MAAIDSFGDEKLPVFALRLALTSHVTIPREGEVDFVAEAEAIFLQPQPKKAGKPTPIKARKTTAKKKTAA